MAFMLSNMEVGMTPPFEYFHTAEHGIVMGMVLTLTSGELVKCAATAKPQYVAMGKPDAEGNVPVAKVQDYMIFDTTLQASGSGLHTGDKVTIHTDALQVTATTGSGVATIVAMLGKEVGDHVRVQF